MGVDSLFGACPFQWSIRSIDCSPEDRRSSCDDEEGGKDMHDEGVSLAPLGLLLIKRQGGWVTGRFCSGLNERKSAQPAKKIEMTKKIEVLNLIGIAFGLVF